MYVYSLGISLGGTFEQRFESHLRKLSFCSVGVLCGVLCGVVLGQNYTVLYTNDIIVCSVGSGD